MGNMGNMGCALKLPFPSRDVFPEGLWMGLQESVLPPHTELFQLTMFIVTKSSKFPTLKQSMLKYVHMSTKKNLLDFKYHREYSLTII